MKNFFFIVCLLGLKGKSLLANNITGNWFENGLNWQQIKAKAKAEHKFIFVDCYASWCGPCKAMDKEVYSLEKVGTFMDQHFISVKVQMDTTEHDDAGAKQWYAEAKEIDKKYHINVFPSLLFFSPDGEVVHKGVGFQAGDEFIHLAEEALDSRTEYYTLLKQYKDGRRDYTTMFYFIQKLKQFNEKQMAKVVAKDYLQNYLYHLQSGQLYTEANLWFIALNVEETSEQGFRLFYEHSEQVDQIMRKKGYARSMMEDMIYRIELEPELAKYRMQTVQPDWDQLGKRIVGKFGVEYTEDPLLKVKFAWYLEKQDWPEVARYTLARIQRVDIDTTGGGMILLNNKLFELVFKHSTDTAYLRQAVQLQAQLVKRNPNQPNMTDTYANLLYKVGRKEDAIIWETKALSLSPEDVDMQNTLTKMKRGEPTWEQ